MSTSEVDTWRAVNIWTKNVIEVPNQFLPLTEVRVPPYKTNENSGTKFKKV
jgi:hypothetical protein